MPDGSTSIWGARFTANISFTQAITDAERLDAQLASIEARVTRLRGGIGGIGGIGGGGPVGGHGTSLAGATITPTTLAGAALLHPDAVREDRYRNRRTGRIMGPETAIIGYADNMHTPAPRRPRGQTASDIFGEGPYEDEFFIPPGTRMDGAGLWRDASGRFTRRANPDELYGPSPTGGLFHPQFRDADGNITTRVSQPGMFDVPEGPYGQTRLRPAGGMPFVPIGTDYRNRSTLSAGQRFMRGTGQGATRAVAGARGVGGFFTPSRLFQAAGAVYLGQEIAYALGAMGRQTLGQSMQLQEYGQLLQNVLVNPELGIGHTQAEAMAEGLMTSRFFPGLPVSVAGLGFSRVELAQAYKDFAPLARITADSATEFRSDLQEAAVASSLLLAKDPTQGLTGVRLALSEVAAGGSQRFRSLAERFEVPRSMLYQIEAEMGGQGVADPFALTIEALNRMGFGTEYLETRAEETLAGQLGKSKALFQDFRAFAFTQATDTITGQLRDLNNAFEAFTVSPAFDETMDKINGFFSLILGGPLGMVSQGIAGNILGYAGVRDPMQSARDVADLVRTDNGSFIDAAGQIISAGEAFSEAAKTLNQAHLERLANAPLYDPNQSLRGEMLVGTLLGLGGLSAFDRTYGRRYGENVRSLAGNNPPTMAQRRGAAWKTARGPLGAIGVSLGASLVGGLLIEGNRQRRGIARAADLAPEVLMEELGWSEAELEAIQNPILGTLAMAQSTLYGAIASIPGVGGAIGDVREFFGRERNPWRGAVGATRKANIAGGIMQGVTEQYRAGMSLGEIRLLAAQGVNVVRNSAQPGDPLYNQLRDVGFTGEVIDTVLAGGRRGVARRAAKSSVREALLHAAERGQTLTIGKNSYDPTRIRTDMPDIISGLLASYGATEGGFDTLIRLTMQGLEAMEETAQNTGKLADEAAPKNPYQHLSLSNLPGLFAGYDPTADPRYISQSGHARPVPLGITPTVTVSGTGAGVSVAGRGGGAGVHPVFAAMGATAVTTRPGHVYGPEFAQYGLAGKMHEGFDLRIGQQGVSDPVYNPFVGAEVMRTGTGVTRGNYMVVKARSGRRYLLAHFKKPVNYKLGDKLAYGEKLGMEGMTGAATAPHLHFALWGDSERNFSSEGFIEALMADTGGVSPQQYASGTAGGVGYSVSFGDINISGGDYAAIKEKVLSAVEMKLDESFEQYMEQYQQDGGFREMQEREEMDKQREGRAP